MEEEVSSDSKVLTIVELLVTKPQLGRTQLHFHVPVYKGRLGADMRQKVCNPMMLLFKVKA